MGLRFRRTISLGKGLRLNVGKNGVSISAGIPGFRKTIHSSGRVTTTVGIPGSGLYYVDTDHIGKPKQRRLNEPTYSVPAQLKQPVGVKKPVEERLPLPLRAAECAHDNGVFEAKSPITEAVSAYETVYTVNVAVPSTTIEQECCAISELSRQPPFRDLFENCDLPVNWMVALRSWARMESKNKQSDDKRNAVPSMQTKRSYWRRD